MTGVFKPRMATLPPAQQQLWPELRLAAELGVALYDVPPGLIGV